MAYSNRGDVWYIKKDHDKALADYDAALRLDPDLASAYGSRGAVWDIKHDYDKALADYDAATRIDPKLASAHGDRAWLLATCPDAKYRDGPRAVESATRACELTGWKDANHLDTLAASYAEAGDFSRAIELQQKANALSTDPEARKKGDKRLTLYQNKTPYHEDPVK